MPHGHHHHEHGHSHAPETFNWAFIIAITANFGFVIIQAIYAYLAHSNSLLADAGHNFGDVLGLIMAWIAALLLSKNANQRFSYGYKKTTIFASLVNALILMFTCGIIAYDAIKVLIHPAKVQALDIIIVALIGIFINAGTALLFLRGAKSDLNIKAAFLHLAYDALVSLGVVIGGVIIYFTHINWIDPLVGLIITVVIVWGTWGLLTESMKLSLDAVPRSINFEAVKNYLESIQGVTEVHDLHIWSLSTKQTALTAHLVMPEKTLSDSTRHQIESDLNNKFHISHITIQIEQGGLAHGQCGC